MQEESIYSLIPQPIEQAPRPPRHVSKHNPVVQPTFSTFGLKGTSKPGYENVAGDGGNAGAAGYGQHTYKKSHATFGTVNNAKAPTDIQQKGTGIGGGSVVLPDEVKPIVRSTGQRKPPVPGPKVCHDEYKSTHPAREEKNFVTANAVENILSEPKKGAEPVNWTEKPHFGKVPPYLNKIKKEISDEYEYIRTMQQSQEGDHPGLRPIGEGERAELIDQLKGKWDEVNAIYQRSSCLSLASLDTIGKVKRKEMYEAQLAQIERDIEKLSKPVVYVKADD
uniref:Enkurin domain-containing protein n=2 Tax=Coccolithus braarudii TaxID=221442 RepID=A0A7S0LMH4_9EUKA|mmetsp:Transcript_48668/g.103849  ORF Transcript_48668/g.103849 Transcript_48668/m.103849 type:complete len:279 (+) Transcript_48668:101-937(+)